jgi:hypothetical protein
MIVIVTIDLSAKPDKEYIDDMRRAARGLTNAPKSIRVRTYEHNNSYRLESCFSMRTTAHYKVVDQIFHDFKFASDNYNEFLDISVSFQK